LFEVSFSFDRKAQGNQEDGFWCMRAYVMAVDEFNVRVNRNARL